MKRRAMGGSRGLLGLLLLALAACASHEVHCDGDLRPINADTAPAPKPGAPAAHEPATP